MMGQWFHPMMIPLALIQGVVQATVRSPGFHNTSTCNAARALKSELVASRFIPSGGALSDKHQKSKRAAIW